MAMVPTQITLADVQLVQAVRENISLLLEQCGIAYDITPFDEVLHKECIDDAIRRGYPIDGDRSVRTYLREGVIYATTAGITHLYRPTQIWIALYTSCAIFMDEMIECFPEETSNAYLFIDRFNKGEPQGSGVLDAFADIIRRASGPFRPIASHLIITSALNFVTGNLLEHETRSMKISNAAHQYPTYQRNLSGVAEAYAFMVFPPEIPLSDYVQAIPDVTRFINYVNDLFSFYKEEHAGETTNHISTLAARTKKSKLEVHVELTERTISVHKRIIEILQGSPDACDAYKLSAAGYVRFHTSSGRYRLEGLGL